MRTLTLFLVALAVAAAPAAPAFAADADFNGAWKLKAAFKGQEVTFAILRFDTGGGKPAATVVAKGAAKDPAVEDVRLADGRLHFVMREGAGEFHVTVMPGSEPRPTRLLGCVRQKAGVCDPLVFEKTLDKEVPPDKVVVEGYGFTDLNKLATLDDPAARLARTREFVTRYANDPVGLTAAVLVVQLLVKAEADPKEVRAAAEQAAATAAKYGRDLELFVALRLTRELVKTPKYLPAALELGAALDKKLTAADDPGLAVRLRAAYIAHLRKAGRAAEAAAVEAELAKAEQALDEQYLKTAIPFEVPPFAGRKTPGKRVVLVEQFTNAHYAPCAAADVAVSALLKAAKPADVVVIQYHLPLPAPEPLISPDAIVRAGAYVEPERLTLPLAFVDGRLGPKELAGLLPQAKGAHAALAKVVGDALEKPAGANLTLKAARAGDKLEVSCDVADLEKTGEKVRLRVALVEDGVRYQGGSGRRIHPMVLRAFLGGADGAALKEKASKNAVAIDLGGLAKQLNEYFDEVGKKEAFLDDFRPLALTNLKVIAFVQDDETKEILQAALVDVPAK